MWFFSQKMCYFFKFQFFSNSNLKKFFKYLKSYRNYNFVNKDSVWNSWKIKKNQCSFLDILYFTLSISLNNDIFLILIHTHYVTLSARVNLPLCFFCWSPLFQALSRAFPHCLPSFISLCFLAFPIRSSLSPAGLSFSLAIVVSTSRGPPSCQYAADGNPRCPPTDTNGYLCQRRNLLLYIPLYKQRVNRAHTLRAPRTGGRASPVSLLLLLPRPFDAVQQVRRG